eukprot:TRINITY_DN21098_c0_g1_i1.p1 TRINITY_DN21098_c0_g1~~TRINITY_DN21098_c0_g1_i1.p1  ORF type:complete len:597 (-),score=94.38 TRINITY_DN21098_c0_g1_i1:7-1752(-)
MFSSQAASFRISGRPLFFATEDLQSIGPARRYVRSLLNSHKAEWFLGGVISMNFILIVWETEAGVACQNQNREDCIPEWISWLNTLFLALYTLEAVVRLFVHRWAYFQDNWNLFDLGIVISGFVDIIISATVVDAGSLSGMQMLRIFRIARLARAAKMIRAIPVLNTMIRGFYSAMSAMLWGFVLILLILLVWSVLAVEVLAESSKRLLGDNPDCIDVFSSVWNCMLWFFQTLVAGDSWGTCSKVMIADSMVAGVIMAGSLITVQLGFTNLILAVIVERAAEAHEEDKQRQIVDRHRKRHHAESKLRQMCVDMDSDGNGHISNAELLQAYEDNQDLRDALAVLDIDQGDLQCLFQLMDVDNSGDLTYDELISCIHKSDSNDIKRQMMMVKLQVEDIWLRVRDHVEKSVNLILQQLNMDDRPPSVTHTSLGATLGRVNSKTRTPQTNPSRSPKAEPVNSAFGFKCEVEPTPSNASTSPAALKDLDEICRSIDKELAALNVRCDDAKQQAATLSLQLPTISDEKRAVSVIADKLQNLHRWTDERLAVVLESLDERSGGLPDLCRYETLPDASLGAPGACFSRV